MGTRRLVVCGLWVLLMTYWSFWNKFAFYSDRKWYKWFYLWRVTIYGCHLFKQCVIVCSNIEHWPMPSEHSVPSRHRPWAANIHRDVIWHRVPSRRQGSLKWEPHRSWQHYQCQMKMYSFIYCPYLYTVDPLSQGLVFKGPCWKLKSKIIKYLDR